MVNLLKKSGKAKKNSDKLDWNNCEATLRLNAPKCNQPLEISQKKEMDVISDRSRTPQIPSAFQRLQTQVSTTRAGLNNLDIEINQSKRLLRKMTKRYGPSKSQFRSQRVLLPKKRTTGSQIFKNLLTKFAYKVDSNRLKVQIRQKSLLINNKIHHLNKRISEANGHKALTIRECARKQATFCQNNDLRQEITGCLGVVQEYLKNLRIAQEKSEAFWNLCKQSLDNYMKLDQKQRGCSRIAPCRSSRTNKYKSLQVTCKEIQLSNYPNQEATFIKQINGVLCAVHGMVKNSKIYYIISPVGFGEKKQFLEVQRTGDINHIDLEQEIDKHFVWFGGDDTTPMSKCDGRRYISVSSF
ncbi:unnamed protein product [Moneuplotes crassus]|uniref:Uncharacterized protein n=1 Tax=Euplotes crassus TaxID=5936 RepID=A0AAD1U5F8_EUPCR|nr:unnamed protein product [Moneuplotes crassus]